VKKVLIVHIYTALFSYPIGEIKVSNLKKEYSITEKKFWRCHVCNDLHFGKVPPLTCPTCGAKRAFVLIDRDEATKVIGERGGAISDKGAVIDAWKQFGSAGEFYKLVDDEEMYMGLAEGVLENLNNHGLKYCPCRITSGDPVKDLKLVCPCQFEAQRVWGDKGECWCGLFVARDAHE
jgi:ferredoxin-thioredoxin reductase catalytic chain